MKMRFTIIPTAIIAAASLLFGGCTTKPHTSGFNSKVTALPGDDRINADVMGSANAGSPAYDDRATAGGTSAWPTASSPEMTGGAAPAAPVSTAPAVESPPAAAAPDYAPVAAAPGPVASTGSGRSPASVTSKTPVYPVWFGTNRKPIVGPNGLAFTSEMNTRTIYGYVEVSVPKTHRFGETGNGFWTRLQRGQLKDDHLKVEQVEMLKRDAFYDQIRRVIKAAIDDGNESEALVFLHGFNNTFEDSAIRAAQIGFDLKVPGPVAFFSWPSQGSASPWTYRADEKSIAASEAAITDFLVEFSQKSGATNINLIAHSMGNRALLSALQRITTNAELRGKVKFNQIILAAPDVDRNDFLKAAKVYASFSKRTTLYTSSGDLALYASMELNGVSRAGYFKPYTITPGVDTIAVPDFDIDLLGHSYFAEAEALLYDIRSLMLQNTAPIQRIRILPVQEDGFKFWQLER